MPIYIYSLIALLLHRFIQKEVRISDALSKPKWMLGKIMVNLIANIHWIWSTILLLDVIPTTLDRSKKLGEMKKIASNGYASTKLSTSYVKVLYSALEAPLKEVEGPLKDCWGTMRGPLKPRWSFVIVPFELPVERRWTVATVSKA